MARASEEISLTPLGSALAERLIHDVLGRQFEPAACELEHILATEIVDAICTLLGHPREYPHGFAIPEGECGRASGRYLQQIIVPLTELKSGQTAPVVYVYTKSDQQLHKLTCLQIRPGTVVRLHQEYPSYVIECDGASIPLDAEVVRNIIVWIEGGGIAWFAEYRIQGGGRRPSCARSRWRFGARDKR